MDNLDTRGVCECGGVRNHQDGSTVATCWDGSSSNGPSEFVANSVHSMAAGTNAIFAHRNSHATVQECHNRVSSRIDIRQRHPALANSFSQCYWHPRRLGSRHPRPPPRTHELVSQVPLRPHRPRGGRRLPRVRRSITHPPSPPIAARLLNLSPPRWDAAVRQPTPRGLAGCQSGPPQALPSCLRFCLRRLGARSLRVASATRSRSS